MQCPKCGWENPAEAAKCNNCSVELTAPADQSPPAPQMPQPPRQPYQPNATGNAPNFMTWSIIVAALSVLLCNVASLVLGIIGAVKSSSANAKNASGDPVGAGADANTAKILDIVGTIVLAVGALLAIPFLIGVIGGFLSFGSPPR